MEHVEEVEDLLYRIRGPGLLSVPKGGVGDEDLFGGIEEDKFVIELYPADLIIREGVSVKVRLLDI